MQSKFCLPFFFLFIFLSGLFPSTLPAQTGLLPEAILSYDTEIKIKEDFSMIITETIRVRVSNINYQRGIFRDLPKELVDDEGNTYKLNFEIVAIFRGDAPEVFFIQDLGAGSRIYMGQAEYILPPDTYTYTIIYDVAPLALDGGDRYQLYWDVTGVRWPVPILKASAIVKLPYGPSERVFEQRAFTAESDGDLEVEGVAYSLDANTNPVFKTTRPLGLNRRFAIFLSWQKKHRPRHVPQRKIEFERLFSSKPNALRTGAAAGADGALKLPIHPPIELNYKPRTEIVSLREAYVNQHPELLLNAYKPYFPVWNMLPDEKPWWGIRGAFCYGPGKGSILGEAETSRYLTNPFLLLGVDDSLPPAQKKRSFTPIYLRLLSLEWDAARAQATATYDFSRFLAEIQNTPYDMRTFPFTLINYNARDFGYRYVYADPQKSTGIYITETSTFFKKPAKLEHSLESGESCAYPGGCGEVVPTQDELNFRLILSPPARLYCKLWKERPKNADQKADFTFIILFQ